MSHSIRGQFGRRLQLIINLVRIRKQGLVWFFCVCCGILSETQKNDKRMMQKRMDMLSVVTLKNNFYNKSNIWEMLMILHQCFLCRSLL